MTAMLATRITSVEVYSRYPEPLAPKRSRDLHDTYVTWKISRIRKGGKSTPTACRTWAFIPVRPVRRRQRDQVVGQEDRPGEQGQVTAHMVVFVDRVEVGVEGR